MLVVLGGPPVMSLPVLPGITFPQCQAMPTTFSMLYIDNQQTTPTAGTDDFISFDEVTGIVTVDTSAYIEGVSPNTPMVVGYRAVKYKICNAIFPL